MLFFALFCGSGFEAGQSIADVPSQLFDIIPGHRFFNSPDPPVQPSFEKLKKERFFPKFEPTDFFPRDGALDPIARPHRPRGHGLFHALYLFLDGVFGRVQQFFRQMSGKEFCFFPGVGPAGSHAGPGEVDILDQGGEASASDPGGSAASFFSVPSCRSSTFRLSSPIRGGGRRDSETPASSRQNTITLPKKL